MVLPAEAEVQREVLAHVKVVLEVGVGFLIRKGDITLQDVVAHGGSGTQEEIGRTVSRAGKRGISIACRRAVHTRGQSVGGDTVPALVGLVVKEFVTVPRTE